MNKFLFLLIALFTVPVFAKNTILIVGDSLSAGFGIDPKQGWVLLLEKRLANAKFDYRVVSDSISGSTTSEGLNRLPVLLKRHRPSITIIELGGNDGLRGLQLSTIQNNLRGMIALVKEAKSKVLLVGVRLPPNYGPDYTQGFQKMYIDLAEKEEVEVVPLFLDKVDTDATLMQPDGVHPNANAQQKMLDNLWKVLVPML